MTPTLARACKRFVACSLARPRCATWACRGDHRGRVTGPGGSHVPVEHASSAHRRREASAAPTTTAQGGRASGRRSGMPTALPRHQHSDMPLGADFVHQAPSSSQPHRAIPELPSICAGAMSGGGGGGGGGSCQAQYKSYSGMNIVQPPGGRTQFTLG